MKKSKHILKTYFETGDKPTQKHYEDLIDSLQHIDDAISDTNLPENIALKNEDNNFSSQQTFQENVTAPIFLGNLIGNRITTGTPSGNFQINNNAGQLITRFTHDKNVDIYGNLSIPTDKYIYSGDNLDLRIWHASTGHSLIENYQGHLFLRNKSNGSGIYFQLEDNDGNNQALLQLDGAAGQIYMRYQNELRMSVISTGVNVEGILEVDNTDGNFALKLVSSDRYTGINFQDGSQARNLLYDGTDDEFFLENAGLKVGNNLEVQGTSSFANAATFDSSATASLFLVDSANGWLVKNTLGNHGVYFDGDETIIQSHGVFSVRADGTSVHLRNTNVDGTLTVDNTLDANGEVSLGWNNSLTLGEDPYKFSISRTTVGLLHTSFRDDYDNPGARIEFVMRHGSVNENVPLYMLGNGESHFQGHVIANSDIFTKTGSIRTLEGNHLRFYPDDGGNTYFGSSTNGHRIHHYSYLNDGIYTTYEHSATHSRFNTTAPNGFRFDKKVEIVDTLDLVSDGTDGDEVLRLSLDGGRDWVFQQKNSGSGTTLLLRSTSHKPFWIEATDTHFRSSIDNSSHLILNHQSKTADFYGTVDVHAALTANTNTNVMHQLASASNSPVEIISFTPTTGILFADSDAGSYLYYKGTDDLFHAEANFKASGYIQPTDTYKSSDGTSGFNGTFIAGAYSITVKDGLITDAVNIS